MKLSASRLLPLGCECSSMVTNRTSLVRGDADGSGFSSESMATYKKKINPNLKKSEGIIKQRGSVMQVKVWRMRGAPLDFELRRMFRPRFPVGARMPALGLAGGGGTRVAKQCAATPETTGIFGRVE